MVIFLSFFCLIVNKYVFMWPENHCILFPFAFYSAPNFFLNWGIITINIIIISWEMTNNQLHSHSSKWLFRAVAKGFSMGTFVLGGAQTPEGKSNSTLSNMECERHPPEMTQRWWSVLLSKKVTAKNVNSCFHRYWNQCNSLQLTRTQMCTCFHISALLAYQCFSTRKLSQPCDFYCPWPCLAAWIISH